MFKAKRVETKTFGEYLAACREKAHFSLAEAAKFSQIQPKFIRALEEGRFRDLPALVYVKGFLRELARLYRLDGNSLVQQFVDEFEITANVESITEEKTEKKFFLPRFIISPKTLTIGAVVLLGLLSVGYLYFQITSLNRPPRLELVSPTSEGVMNLSVVQVRGKTEPGATITLNSQPIVVDSSGEFGENISLAPGTNLLVIKAQNKFGQETSLTRTLVYQEKNIAGSFTEAIEGSKLVLEIKIGPGAAWVSLTADEKQVYAGTMLSGAQKQVTAGDKIVLTTGNAGSTHVYLNEKDLGVLGKEGEVIRDIEFSK